MSRRSLFVWAILASSFLIFLVQPMVGKRILPWFGGTQSVWTLCLAFYQTSLFLGYAYAHFVIRFVPPARQLVLHALVVGAACVALPVLPGDEWRTLAGTRPSLEILKMLSSTVALPFVALASTGPLIQAWYARSYPNRSPYPLYAVSNLGSLAALLAYPFFLEPRLSLSTTGDLWTYAFVATGLAVLGCAFIGRAPQREAESPEGAWPEPIADTPFAVVGLWILLAGCAVILLTGVTNSVCLDVASVPFLWILPLATYLVTFILCFASEGSYRPLPYILLTVIAFLLTLGLRFLEPLGEPLFQETLGVTVGEMRKSIYVQIPAYCALLFGSCMILHGELYRLRPPPNRLTAFYLCVSGGGALGGLFVGLLAPVLFDDYYEVRIGLGLALLLVLAARATSTSMCERIRGAAIPFKIAVPIGLVLCAAALWPPSGERDVEIYRERSFFGVLNVLEFGKEETGQRQLFSGSTLHGVQFFGHPEKERLPTSYYGRATGIAAAFARRTEGQPSHVGLIGLGIGTLSAYAREGDRFRYYEIDPTVAYLARDSGYFTYLERSDAEIEIVLGDARLAIADEQDRGNARKFDFLVLDAFTSDAIPVHLLTVEAFELYEESLDEHGLLAVHVTNRHFNLTPLVARVGLEVGLHALVVNTDVSSRFQSQSSVWVFLSRNQASLRGLAQFFRRRTERQGLPSRHFRLGHFEPAQLGHVRPWSDDYSDLRSVLRSKK